MRTLNGFSTSSGRQAKRMIAHATRPVAARSAVAEDPPPNLPPSDIWAMSHNTGILEQLDFLNMLLILKVMANSFELQQIDDTVHVMKQNINKVQERGDNIDTLQDKADQVTQSARDFNRVAAKARKRMIWENNKWRLMIILVIILIIVAIAIGEISGSEEDWSRPTADWIFVGVHFGKWWVIAGYQQWLVRFSLGTRWRCILSSHTFVKGKGTFAPNASGILRRRGLSVLVGFGIFRMAFQVLSVLLFP